MVNYNFWGSTFEDFYYSPNTVIIAFFLLVFLFVFSALMKTRLGENKGVVVVVTLIIDLIFVLRFRELILGLFTFNVLLIVLVAAVIFRLLLWPMFRRFKSGF